MRTAKNEPKKVVVMLSTTFPVGHKREKQPTGFRESLLAGKKIHTIREDAKGLWQKRCKEINEGKKYISIREWTGRPYKSEQRIIKEVLEFNDVYAYMLAMGAAASREKKGGDQ